MGSMTSKKYALFKGPLLCSWRKIGAWSWDDQREEGWWVINGWWHYKPEPGTLPLWEGDELPDPEGDYNENIYLIEEFLNPENHMGEGI